MSLITPRTNIDAILGYMRILEKSRVLHHRTKRSCKTEIHPHNHLSNRGVSRRVESELGVLGSTLLLLTLVYSADN